MKSNLIFLGELAVNDIIIITTFYMTTQWYKYIH